jgi:hypothetical protein
MQNPLETGGATRLTPCPRCGKHIERDAVRCPFCTYHVRRSRLLRRGAWGLAVPTVVVVGLVVLVRTGVLPAPPWTVQETGPAAAAAAPRPATPPSNGAVTAAPIVVAPPDTTGGRIETAPPPPSDVRPAPPSPARRAPVNLRVKWTAEWANVREGRTLDSPVVRVLAPGVRLEIGDLEAGWWAVYENGVPIGYIANSVLGDAPAGP